MYFKAKYIILDSRTPIVFPETYGHNEMKYWVAPGAVCTGAGFVSITEHGFYKCYGESTSLKIKSNGDSDSKILNLFLAGQQKE
jgi:hypothetical protein